MTQATYLYTDPRTLNSGNPILYADTNDTSFGKESTTTAGEFLYTFSDIIVFVEKDIRYEHCPFGSSHTAE